MKIPSSLVRYSEEKTAMEFGIHILSVLIVMLPAVTTYGQEVALAIAATGPDQKQTAKPVLASPEPNAASEAPAANRSDNKMTGKSDYLNCFEIVWQTVNDEYPDPTFGGLDWNEVRDRYQPLIANAESDEAFYKLVNEMLFGLNVSHLAVIPHNAPEEIEPILSAEGSIGIDVRLIEGDATITSVIPESPGAQAGLRPGFIIQSINGTTIKQITEEREAGLTTPPFNDRNKRCNITGAILERVYGSPGSEISIIYLDERQEKQEKKIVRVGRGDRIVLSDELPPFFVEFETKHLGDSIGYIRFNAFLPPIHEKFPQTIEKMSDASGLIIDLRGNPGGAFFVRKALAETLVRERTLFWRYKSRNETRDVYLEPAETIYEGPVAVLVDVRSWSSSEEFAGGLQAIGRATIVGERTPGKVMVQREMELPNGALFIYPFEQTRTADDTILEGNGVVPDIEVTLDRILLMQGIDSQLEAAIQHIGSEVRK